MSLEFDIVGKLFPNPLTMLVQLCSTGVLFYFVYKYLWSTVHNYLDKRAEYSQSLIFQAQEMKSEATQMMTDAKDQLKSASVQARSMVEMAKDESSKVKEKTLKQTKEEVDKKFENAQKEIEQERIKMQESIRREIIEVAFEATNKLISDKVDEDVDRKALEKFLKEVGR